MVRQSDGEVATSKIQHTNEQTVDNSVNRSNVTDQSSKTSTSISVLKSSIFNLFFQEYNQDIWTSCEPYSNSQEVLADIEGDLYAFDWCFRISKDKKMEWLFIVFKDQYAVAYTDESCKTPIAYFDLNFTKLDYLQIEMGDDQDQRSYYG